MGLGRLAVGWVEQLTGIGGVDDSAAVVQRLVEAWSEPHRAYHTLQHLGECQELLERWGEASPDRDAIGIALWFHDAVYDTTTHDSEDRSITLARQLLGDAGVASAPIEQVARLIEVTKHTAVAPVAADELLMVDIDLAILGAAPARFDEFCRQVRVEYGWVPAETFNAKRADFLASMLGRPAIYETAAAADELEARARFNLEREVARLRALA